MDIEYLGLIPFEKFVTLAHGGYPTPEAIAENFAPSRPGRFPAPERVAWLASSGASETLDVLARFTGSREFCADVLRGIRTGGRPGAELLEPKSWAAIFHTGRRSATDIDAFWRAWEDSVAQAGDRTLVIVSLLLDFGDATALVDTAVPSAARGGRRIVILDREALLDHLSWLPWLWSRWSHQPGTPRIARVREQDEFRDAILPTPMAQHLDRMNPPRHPALSTNIPISFLLSGREGTGKSTAVWQLCQERGVDLVIAVRGMLTIFPR